MRALTSSLLLIALLAGGGAAAQDHAHMDHSGHAGIASPAKPAAKAPPGQPALFTADELAFVQGMIMHHQQAVDMAALMEGRATHPELIRFAGLVADAQRAEIGGMQSMLDLAAERGVALPAHPMHGDPPMAGMLSGAEMKALAAAKGPEFERLWLQGMMVHHEGGLAMARVQELREALDGRQSGQLAVMVDDILSAQRAEIGMMTKWLADWGLAEAGDRRAPAVQVQSPPEGGSARAGRPLVVLGVAVDDTGVATVDVAVHDLGKDRWLRRDGTWGAREARPATLIGSGPSSTAWRLDFTPPAPGRYAVTAEAVDTAGKRGSTAEAWEVEAR